VLDPVLAAVGDTRHLVLALDDLLHAIPLDALPLGASLVGERRVFELRPALWQRLVADRDLPEGRGLVVLGNADYDADPASTPALMPASAERDEAPSSGFPAQRGATRSVLPVGANRARFVSLPATREEALGIARLHAQAFEGLAVRELEGAEASRGVFLVEAPEARFLHLATHGWFASDSILSASEVGQSAGKLGSAQALTAAEQVSGTSPMLLCGLAFAGANREQDESLYVGGTLTAEEIASLDISTCELAVLSACDTNVGIRRAGQGVASLQKALHMAGARSVITSLWKVPDEATKELMLDFYRRLWVEKKPKWRALWEAKMKLRNAKDANGDPLYTTRDWAAWVLTGEPD